MSQLFGLATHVGHVHRSKTLGRAIVVLTARQRSERIVVFIVTAFGELLLGLYFQAFLMLLNTATDSSWKLVG
jgi:hypothetical protein